MCNVIFKYIIYFSVNTNIKYKYIYNVRKYIEYIRYIIKIRYTRYTGVKNRITARLTLIT